MSDTVALFPAPAGYVVDFDNPQRRGDVASYWCFGCGLVLAAIFAMQRVYVKLVIGTGWTTDDWLLLVSWIASILSQVCVVYGFADGFIGVHAWEMSVHQFNRFLLDLFISAPIYILAGSCTKIALLVFYLKVSPQQWLRYCVFATMAFILGYSIGIFFTLIFACSPVQKSFDVSITEGTCVSSTALYIATAVCNIASDLILFLLPMPMVFGLQLPTKQKLGLLFVFTIGSITVVTSIARAWVLPTLLGSSDNSWDVAYASMLIIVEANLVIICGSLPTLRKFFRHVAPKIIGESTYGGHRSRSKGSHSRKPWTKSSSKLGAAPDLVTFGSLPVNGHRAYAKFGGRSGKDDDYILETIADPGREYEDVGKKGHVNTHVVAGGEGYEQSGGHHHWRSAENGRIIRSSSSGESQLPIMGLAGINKTTRIEVSYDTRKPGGMI